MRPAKAPSELLDGQPFRLDQARTWGVTPGVLRGPLFRRVCREVYVSAETQDTIALRLAAVQLILPPEAVLSGSSAAWAFGIDVARTVDEPLQVTLPRGISLRGRGLFTCVQAQLAPADIVQRRGVLVTSALRTAYDLARQPDIVEAVVAVDAFWHRHRIKPDELLAYAAAHPGLRGVRQIVRVVELADPGAESPMESRLRMVLVLECGLPRPQTQLVVIDQWGRVIARLDMGYPLLRMGAEYDGRVHATDRARAKDLRRHNLLLGEHWHNLRYSADAFYNRHAAMVLEVKETYAMLLAQRR
jgi:hypothetical protein